MIDRYLMWCLAGGLLLLTPVLPAEEPARLRRSESFFGLHFDKHSRLTDQHLGATLTAEMIEQLLTEVQPDYIQVDTKGHPGISSYPTRVGTSPESFDKDPLRLLRDVTARHGVALYSHFSGVLDGQAIVDHPDWAVVLPDGTRDDRCTSFFSPYADQLMIPQLKELRSEYQIDGVWVDGECWGVIPDYGAAAVAAFTAETGIEQAPAPGDENYPAFLEFFRRRFRSHVAHYLTELHKFDPDFQICSNWAFSSFMPEAVSLDVDFLSGDVASRNTVYSAAFEARCLAPQGLPWDLMAWSFVRGQDEGARTQTTKSAIHLQQEAAETIAMGGGFQVYFKQNADMSIQPWIIPLAKDVAEFCRERQPFTHKSTPVPEIALLYSRVGFNARTEGVYRHFDGEIDSLRGISAALLDGQHAHEILLEHHLAERLDEYSLVVVPEWEQLDPELIPRLKQFVHRGGRLLVIGAQACHLLQDACGVRAAGEPTRTFQHFGLGETMATVDSLFLPVETEPDTEVVARTYSTNDFRFPAGVAATVSRWGDGQVAGIYFDLGRYYSAAAAPLHRQLITNLIDRLLPERIVQVKGSSLVHVALNQLQGDLLVHLINAGGQHRDPTVSTYDELPPIGPLSVSVRTSQRPERVVLQPSGREIPFQYTVGYVHCDVPSVSVHEIVQLIMP